MTTAIAPLSTRARNVLRLAISWRGVRMPTTLDLYEVLPSKLTDAELIRRAAKIKPPLSFHLISQYLPNCGKTTAREVCRAMGLPAVAMPESHVQCPRCGHVFGGTKK
jgi:hypothetical protein